jgi:hypothetical protein
MASKNANKGGRTLLVTFFTAFKSTGFARILQKVDVILNNN